MLQLVAIVFFKLCWLLALFKLATTVFHLEFGISRHYLRLLEMIFRIGEQKFRLAEPDDDEAISCSAGPADKPLGPAERPDSLAGATNRTRKRATVAFSAPVQETAKMRHISTPDGPPVFLLDQCEDFDDDEDEDSQGEDDDDCHRDGHSREAKGERGGKLEPEQTDSNKTTSAPHPQPTRPDPSEGGGHSNGASQSAPQDSWPGNGTGSPRFARRRRKHEFQLYDPCKLVARGIAAIIDDDVIKRFTPEQLQTWNLLTRTNAKNYQFMSRSMGLFWLFGLLMRYLILLPLRIMFTLTGLVWLISSMLLIGALPRPFRLGPYRLMSLMSFRMLACGLTSRLEFHNRQFKAQLGDICVANHTSPLDVVLLACDNCYALVGQRHGGILGLLESVLSRATEHVWFDRAEMRDRQLVTKRLKEHITDKSRLPVLIFPEGTCINNSAVMMFRKGSFETTDRVCPVAIKYDPRFGDPFWNSSKQGYLQYLLMMMSSWAIKCDVWYLPPMDRLEGESSAEFANRVKAEIAKQGGLDDLAWDGQLKRTAPKMVWKFQQQEDFAHRIKLE